LIAALFVETNGTYFGLPNVDPWDIRRDARNYVGPYPVVAHPPCQLWVNFAALNYKRYGGEHNRPGNDGGCFAAALSAVRKYGGVLEHPAGSKAWEQFSLVRPRRTGGWVFDARYPYPFGRLGAWTCEVWQSAYGHPARKRTWLFYVGQTPPPELNWARKAGTHQVGWFDRVKPTLGKKAASRTPEAFRDVLISLAANSRAQELSDAR